jgi:hypothetical protein
MAGAPTENALRKVYIQWSMVLEILLEALQKAQIVLE